MTFGIDSSTGKSTCPQLWMSETNKHDYYLIPNLQTTFGYDTVIHKSKLIYILIQLRNFYINCNLIGLFNFLNLVKNVIGFFLFAVFSKNFDMFVWMSGFQKSLEHTDFNMFVDEWTSANESPDPREPDTPRKQTPPPRSACWEIRSTSGRYAFYWNVILYAHYFPAIS